jgi:hypothetical protein
MRLQRERAEREAQEEKGEIHVWGLSLGDPKVGALKRNIEKPRERGSRSRCYYLGPGA